MTPPKPQLDTNKTRCLTDAEVREAHSAAKVYLAKIKELEQRIKSSKDYTCTKESIINGQRISYHRKPHKKV